MVMELERRKSERPSYLKIQHLEYLDKLKLDEQVNMFESREFLMSEFKDLTKEMTTKIVSYWMQTYNDRHNIIN